jgi:hypothetical protein
MLQIPDSDRVQFLGFGLQEIAEKIVIHTEKQIQHAYVCEGLVPGISQLIIYIDFHSRQLRKAPSYLGLLLKKMNPNLLIISLKAFRNCSNKSKKYGIG